MDDRLTIDCISDPAQLRSVAADYARLHVSMQNDQPFMLLEWHEAWCRHFLNIHVRIRESCLFIVLREVTGRCVAIFPFVVSRRGIGPFASISIDFIGADPALTEIRGPLIEPGFERRALIEVRKFLAGRQDWDWVAWCSANPIVSRALAELANVQPHSVIPNLILDLPATWDEFHGKLKRNIRESLRHCYNSLKRSGHVFELNVVVEPGQVSASIDQLIVLHRMRSLLPSSRAHIDRFAHPVSRAFLYDVCERMAERGALRVFELKIGSSVVASRIGFVVGESLYLYYSGFDPAWSKFSVMTTTLAEAIKYAIRCRLKTVNLSPAADPSKTRWAPRVVPYELALEKRDRLRSKIASSAYLFARAESSSARILTRTLNLHRRWD